MIFQMRQGVFETNSSSTHSLNICTEEEYAAWENKQVFFLETYNYFNVKEGFYTKDEVSKLIDEKNLEIQKHIDEGKAKSWEELIDKDSIFKEITKYDWDYGYQNTERTELGIFAITDTNPELEHYDKHFTTPSGDKMVAFGDYGYDG